MSVKVDHVSNSGSCVELTGLTATVRKATMEPYVRPVGNDKRILINKIKYLFM